MKNIQKYNFSEAISHIVYLVGNFETEPEEIRSLCSHILYTYIGTSSISRTGFPMVSGLLCKLMINRLQLMLLTWRGRGGGVSVPAEVRW